MPREQYLLDSAHHGLAMNPDGTKLCVAGTMADYATVVAPRDFSYRLAATASKPYWVDEQRATARYCFISFSGDDRVVAISYATGAAGRAASRSATTRSGCATASSPARWSPGCRNREAAFRSGLSEG